VPLHTQLLDVPLAGQAAADKIFDKDAAKRSAKTTSGKKATTSGKKTTRR
jgi:hypothetical protein